MSVLFDFLEFVTTGSLPAQDVLHRVLVKCRALTRAEAGSIFVVRAVGRRKRLDAMSMQNDMIVMPAHTTMSIPIDARSIAGYVALSGQTVRADDVYALPDILPYRFNNSRDLKSGFRTRSMLVLALKNHAGQVIGVVSLLNKRSPAGEAATFTLDDAEMLEQISNIIGGAIERALMMERISEQNRRLTERSRLLQRQRKEIATLRDQTEDAFQISIRLLARAAELHDEDTGNHIVRVNEYSFLLARRLGMPKAFCDEIRYSAQLHDVGKMSVDTALLKKRGGLSPAERREINRHAEYGREILSRSDRLKMAAEIALCHHEKWDGSGYPNGLKGEKIPLAARIVQLADVYDALRSARPYKRGFSHERAYRVIVEGDSRIDPVSHFDPAMIALFKSCHTELDKVWRKLQD